MSNSRSSTRPARGFTLIEMVLSISIVGVVMGATAGVALFVHRAAATSNTAASSAPDAIRTLQEDLQYATRISAATANSITLEVPDRNADGVADQVRYAWSGVAGASLFRVDRIGAATAIVPSVAEFALSTFTDRIGSAPTMGESSSRVLVSNHGSGANASVGDASFVAQAFSPSLPADALWWRVTSVRVGLARDSSGGLGGDLRVRLHNSTFANVGPRIASCADVRKSSLPSNAGWYDFPVIDCPQIDPSQQIAVLLAGEGNSRIASLDVQSSGSIPAGTALLESSNAGGGWSNQSGKCLKFEIEGVVGTRSGISPVHRIVAVTVRLRAANSNTPWMTTIAPINQPEAP